MTVREIIRMGHPTLRQVARAVSPEELVTEEFRVLIEDMADTLKAAGGIGLAAPQIDVSLRVAIIEIPGGTSRYGEIPAMPLSVFVNPVVVTLGDEQAAFWEGCLSVPGLRGLVERPQQVKITASDLQGKTFELELQGFLATVFQHEFDHLDGVLYVDRLKDSRLLVFEDLLELSEEDAQDSGHTRP